MEQSDESRDSGMDLDVVTGVSEPMGAPIGATAGEEVTGQELITTSTAGMEPWVPMATAGVGVAFPSISEVSEPRGTPTIAITATWEEATGQEPIAPTIVGVELWVPMATTATEGCWA